MWFFITRTLLRYRLVILITLILITIFMGYKASQVQLSYEMARMLPADNKHFVEYEQFKKTFGEDGNVIFIGFQDSAAFEKNHFLTLYDLCERIKAVDGIERVLSVSNVYSLEKNDSLRKFELLPVVKERPTSQLVIDSLKDKILNMKFFEGMLFNRDNQSYMIGITLEKSKINDKSRIRVVDEIISLVEAHEASTGIEMHCSGLPYIRTKISQMIQSELYLFIVISLIVSALLITAVFKSPQVVMTSLAVVMVCVIWAMGFITLFGFKISILIAVMPSLIIITVIENCIFLVNKYHWEFKLHGNKIKSLSRVVSRMGFATFMTNTTTAAGFACSIFTSNKMMREFGIVSSVGTMLEFVLSLVIMVIIFSYLPEPKQKHLKHLDRKSTNFVIDWIIFLVTKKRIIIYSASAIIIGVCLYGVTLMEVSGKLTDDLPDSNPIAQDLKFFEKNVGGVMPFEIIIDTKEPKGLFKDGAKAIYKIKKLQKDIQKDSTIGYLFSRPLSVVEAVSFANQAYHNGNPKYYMVPPPMEMNKLGKYMSNSSSKQNAFNSFLDSTKQITRVSIQIADIGTNEMNRVLSVVQPKVDSIFPASDYNVTVTGSSIVHAKGTESLIGNLWMSIIIGIFLISTLIALIFNSVRMIVIAMVVNLIPLLITAAIMGFFSIPIKPSTIIVFSIALGISIDNAILFLARYRHELKVHKCTITKAVKTALSESGFSMMYSSLVLILGFAIYMISGFGGLKALGFLISMTLFVALFFNILLLPSLLLSFERKVSSQELDEPLVDIDIYEEDSDETTEEDAILDGLHIK